MKWYLKVWKQYADFSGRARRKEYWMFSLFNVIIISLLMLKMLMSIDAITGGYGGVMQQLGISLYYVYTFAALIPSLAVCIRRLHDIGKSGWNILFGLIPLIGAIILIVWYCQDSQAGENQYGLNPKIS